MFFIDNTTQILMKSNQILDKTLEKLYRNVYLYA